MPNRRVFFIILLFGAIVFFFHRLQNQKGIQYLLTILITLSYLVLSLWHHHQEGDLNAKIVVEYLLFSAFAVILLLGVMIL